MRRRSFSPWLFALLGLLGTAAPALAQQGSSNPFDWSHPWSYLRIGATVLCVGLAFLLAFGLYFRVRLNPERDIKTAPWPRNVFGETVIVGILLSALSFLLFFVWLQEVRPRFPFRPFPSNMGQANKYSWEVAVCLIALVLCVISRFMFRHRDTSTRKAN